MYCFKASFLCYLVFMSRNTIVHIFSSSWDGDFIWKVIHFIFSIEEWQDSSKTKAYSNKMNTILNINWIFNAIETPKKKQFQTKLASTVEKELRKVTQKMGISK